MLKFFSISDSDSIGKAIDIAIRLRYGAETMQIRIPSGDAADAFSEVAEKLDKILKDGDFVNDRYIGVLDWREAKGESDLHAFYDVQGRLVLAFPEIQWIPIYQNSILFDENPDNTIMTLDLAVELCKNGYSPLFDGDGLRSSLIERAHQADVVALDEKQYSRTDVAYAVDDESSFAYMNAYVAYRFGYRAFPITSKAVAEQLLEKRTLKCEIPHARGITVDTFPNFIVFEDVCLEFPDAEHSYNKNILFGDKRAKEFPLLQKAEYNIFTTACAETEKVANGDRLTIAEYFKGRLPTRTSDARYFKWKAFWERCKRAAFNKLGGWWPGYWALNILEVSLILLVLLSTFFLCDLKVFLLVGLSVFLICGVFRPRLTALVRRFSSDSLWLTRLLNLHHQWDFMPKRYENHAPIRLDSLGHWEIARKPLAGIFGLRNKCKLPNGRHYKLLFSSNDLSRVYHEMRTKRRATPSHAQNQSNHSAPGAALAIASLLISRAERLKRFVVNSEGAIHCAVLANVAFEILNYKTPAMCIEALKWKHYYEVFAECSFIGVRADLDMKDRYIDIHNAMGRICRSGDGMIRDKVFASGMAEIVDNLASLLSSEGKSNEASFFTAHSRRLHRKLLNPFARALLAYPEWVLRDKINFFASLAFFSLVFLFYFGYTTKCWTNIVENTYLVMFASQVPPAFDALAEKNVNFALVLTFAKQIGLLHLGFITAAFCLFMKRK